MILTGGRFRGRRIAAPPGDRVRPTPARVKEALFSILAPRIADAAVLDLFAGSGALGLEALSRGAATVTFVEADARTAAALKNTLRQFAINAEEARVLNLRAERAPDQLEARYNIVLADPPYAQAPPIEIFAALHKRGRLADDAILVYEHAAKAPPFDATPFQVTRRESWGEVGITFLAIPPTAETTSIL